LGEASDGDRPGGPRRGKRAGGEPRERSDHGAPWRWSSSTDRSPEFGTERSVGEHAGGALDLLLLVGKWRRVERKSRRAYPASITSSPLPRSGFVQLPV